MPVVCLREPLKRLAGNRAELALGGRTVGEALHELEREHPATSGWLLDERGRLRPHINVFVNGEPGGQDAEVGAEDRIHVIPAISGG